MKTGKIFIAALMMTVIASFVSFAAGTYSEYWKQDASGNWYIQKPDGTKVTNAWLCDDAVAANGKDVWYLLDGNGQMISAGLVQDGTGNYYSIETEHNGYFGMLRYKSGNYGGVNLQLEGSHNGSFAAIKNADGIAALNAKYGLKSVANINNNNCVYTSSFGGKAPAAGGNGAGSVSGGSSGGSGVTALSGERYTVVGGPARIVPENGLQGREVCRGALWAQLVNVDPARVNESYQISPNERYYYPLKNGNRDKYMYGLVYEYNGDTLVTGAMVPSERQEAGTWVVDNTRQDAMYGKTNLRYQYADGKFAGYGWHSPANVGAYAQENQALYDAKDPDYMKWSHKWTMYFTEDGYLVRNAIINNDFTWVGEDIKVGYNGTWLDKDY